MVEENEDFYNEGNQCILRLYTICLFTICICFIIGVLLFINNYDKIFKYEDEYLNITRI